MIPGTEKDENEHLYPFMWKLKLCQDLSQQKQAKKQACEKCRGSRKEEVAFSLTNITTVCHLPLFHISPLTESLVEQAIANYMLSAFYMLRLQGKGADDELMRVTDSDGQNLPFKTAIIAWALSTWGL